MGKPTRKVAQVRVRGPLAPFAALYKEKLEEHGFTPVSVVKELRQLAHFSRWLEDRGVPLRSLDSGAVAQFVAVRRVEVGGRASSSASLALLLDSLRDTGVIVEETVTAEGSGVGAVLARFER